MVVGAVSPGMILALVRGVALALAVMAEALLLPIALYLLLLTVASCFARRGPQASCPPTKRFAILVPAHNEEPTIGTLLANLRTINYPTALYSVHVVADNCTDRTAAVAREFGVTVHERHNRAAPGKGNALNWLFDRLHAGDHTYDAVVILDADSIVSANFLREMNAGLCQGKQAVQSFNDVANPDESWTASLRYMAFCLYCYLRPLGRSALGLSVGLCGNGMCLSRAIVERFRWDPDAPAEDQEFHMRLLSAGIEVAFAPAAHVYSEMPNSLAAARSQTVRWERGKIEVMRQHSLPLLLHGLVARRWPLVDGALAMIIPPFSLTIGLSLAALALSFAAGWWPAVAVALAIVAMQLGYTVRGLLIMPVRSARLYLALVYVPWLILWKVWVYIAVALGAGKGQWVRTARASQAK